MGVGPGPDGLERCWWCLGAPEYIDYHDRSWGRPIHDDRFLFELLTLESFQSGLSWLTILRKQDGFRAAFDDWEIGRVAEYGEQDIARLLADTGIVRNRAKIEAAIANARAVRTLQASGESLDDLVWQFAPEPATAPRSGGDLQATTPASTAMAKELKRRGFRFIGPTTAYSLMQGAGLVNDHLAGCAFRGLSAMTPERR
jgi:DNA-3-methyladenine glycosylase I